MFDDYYRARELVEDLLKKDLYGPVYDDEVIEELPAQYYICGRLHPQGIQLNQEDNERSGLDDEIDDAEQALNLSYAAYPSSIAISFTVKANIAELAVSVAYAWYEILENATEDDALNEEANNERVKPKWKRNAETDELIINTAEEFQVAELSPGLELRTYLQRAYSDGTKTFTICMINCNMAGKDIVDNNKMTFFQTHISVKSCKQNDAVFIEKQAGVKLGKDDEVRTLEMLYRHNKVFGTGHGCSVGWCAEVGAEEASEVYTDFLPHYDLLQMKPSFHVDKNQLAFEFLAEQDRREVINALQNIPDSYRRWIENRQNEVDTVLEEMYRSVADMCILSCSEALKRISQGIELLEKDDEVFHAFQLVNKAMYLQRVKHNPGKAPDSHGWYPFQLAFILQELPSIADPDDSYRNTVDLLWFPTGGGKTEAYLGLTAFTVFLRRMRAVRNERTGGGVAVFMRYTLRLLTLQQFERAAALICACEYIRQQIPRVLGEEEIAIGLWVGGGLTPNSRSDAKSALKLIHNSSGSVYDVLKDGQANPCQVLRCPWCRSEIKPAQYTVDDESLKICCSNDKCDFYNRLPLYLVDEDIYQYRPSMVIGTIDKFAQMAWDKRVGLLFGITTDHLPPELIIQDELHLISGPLGTVAGLYEIAVDEFCKTNGVKAKIVSSTATIRNAKSQIMSLYGRDYRQFPPQGLDIRDSYFAVESAPDERPARKYVGLLSPGTSGNTILIRVYSILIIATRYLKAAGYSDDIVDSFWTIIGYFNSLKQLGGAVVNVIDDVQGRLAFLAGTKFNSYFLPSFSMPDSQHYDELTSRKTNSEIGSVLKNLEISYPDPDTYDLVLASNMLSVGVDIDRLGIMVLQGQPKTNSEYIQATSRVGRQTPGLVVTMYDASRSRDRSHYEQFNSYHSSLYRFVEATSLTPFAARARDRALHASFISLCRQLIDDLRNNEDAENIEAHLDEAREIIDTMLERVKLIDKAEYDDSRAHLERILDEWALAATHGLSYGKIRDSSKNYLMTKRFDTQEDAIPTLNSMRNVDVECEVRLEG